MSAPPFRLSWSHYVILTRRLDGGLPRDFYETEALRGGWTVRQLERQIESQFFERTALSRNKVALLQRGMIAKPEDAVTPEQEIKDPFVLEFLALKDEYSETDLEDALISELETFLLELGGDFAFIGRQRRLRIGTRFFPSSPRSGSEVPRAVPDAAIPRFHSATPSEVPARDELSLRERSGGARKRHGP